MLSLITLGFYLYNTCILLEISKKKILEIDDKMIIRNWYEGGHNKLEHAQIFLCLHATPPCYFIILPLPSPNRFQNRTVFLGSFLETDTCNCKYTNIAKEINLNRN